METSVWWYDNDDADGDGYNDGYDDDNNKDNKDNHKENHKGQEINSNFKIFKCNSMKIHLN